MKDIKDIRSKINEIDDKMRELFEERMRAVREVAEYKMANALPILDAERERENIARGAAMLEDEQIRPYYVSFLESNMAISRSYQKMLTEEGKRTEDDLAASCDEDKAAQR